MAKTENYTAAQTAALVEAYKAAEDAAGRDAVVKSYADEFGKSVASIRAKLVREGVYVKKPRTAKDGSAVVSKAALVDIIAANVGKSADAFDSLEKANKSVLKVLAAATAPAEEETPETA